jgi:hypothetical protein
LASVRLKNRAAADQAAAIYKQLPRQISILRNKTALARKIRAA